MADDKKKLATLNLAGPRGPALLSAMRQTKSKVQRMPVHGLASKTQLWLLAIAACVVIKPALAAADDRVAELAAACSGCHGEKGIPQDKATPIIWGQNEGYIYLQLRDFQKGSRKSELMQPMVEGLERQDIRDLAAYFAGLQWPNIDQEPTPPDVVGKAESINDSVACTACHQSQYEGDGTTPRLAGQSREYLYKTMQDFRSRARGNNPGMSDILRAVSEDDVTTMAEYLAGLRLLPSARNR